VMEMSHRSKDYQDIIDAAEADLRTLMGIPDSYKVMFLQGGASLQFLMVPMNLMVEHKKAHFIKTGQWAKKAIAEAGFVGGANVVASSEDKTFSYIPDTDPSMFTADADYVHITSNNTIYGTRFTKLPETDLPIVSDMSSYILSETVDVNDYGVIYAGAQKNIGPAGVTVVIVRGDLLDKAPDNLPHMLSYKTQSESGSMFNTPPTYAIYIAGLVFKWLLKNGGVPAMQEVNERKAARLYDFIDNSALFSNPVNKADRSMMNVTFVTGDADKDAAFVKGAKGAGLVNIKGHRSVGGMRASIYNAMPEAGVDALISFMKKFEMENT